MRKDWQHQGHSGVFSKEVHDQLSTNGWRSLASKFFNWNLGC